VKINGKDVRALWFSNGTLKIIDQTKLPKRFKVYECKKYRAVARAIRGMVVRGGPAIGAAAAYGMAMGAERPKRTSSALRNTRPTARDLFYAVSYMEEAIEEGKNPVEAADRYVEALIDRCKRIGVNGLEVLGPHSKIMTHCNAGSLATVDYGTALSPIRLAHSKGLEPFVWVSETRPRLQGMLTAWELGQEGISHQIIVDGASGDLMRRGEVDLVLVGADRITSGGDVVNKVGTYEKAVLAHENGVPFYVAAPKSTFDPETERGDDVPIEERDEKEVLFVGKRRVAPKGSRARNPCFDVTPARYVSGVITEDGITQ